MSLGRQLILLLGLAFLPAIGQAVYYSRTSTLEQPPADSALVDVTTAQSWGDRVLWLDARPEEQFTQRHIPGAMQLNEDHWDDQLRMMLTAWSPERKVIVYCSRKTCNASHEVAERLRKEAGLANVFVLEGGWEEWEKQHPQ